jgi:hypothetical protein
MSDDLFKAAALPEGDYAIVELLGHRTLIGRVGEVERFGTKMLQIEPIFQGRLLDPVLHGGSSIYGMTPCSREVAASKAPTSSWQLPTTVAATLPPALIEAQKSTYEYDDFSQDDDE